MNWKHWPGKSHCNKTQSRLSLPASRGSWVKDSRRDGRVVEGARLESVYTATYQGFESLSLPTKEQDRIETKEADKREYKKKKRQAKR
jgi:hypothetical protein